MKHEKRIDNAGAGWFPGCYDVRISDAVTIEVYDNHKKVVSLEEWDGFMSQYNFENNSIYSLIRHHFGI